MPVIISQGSPSGNKHEIKTPKSGTYDVTDSSTSQYHTVQSSPHTPPVLIRPVSKTSMESDLYFTADEEGDSDDEGNVTLTRDNVDLTLFSGKKNFTHI